MMIDLVVKATVLLGVAWIAAFVLRGRAASTRHAVWVGLLAAALLLPAIVSLTPAINVPLLPADAPKPVKQLWEVRVGPNEIAVETERNGKRVVTDHVFLPDRSGTTPQQAPAAWSSIFTPRNLLLGAWLLVALMLVLRIAAAHVQARRLLRACSDPSSRIEAAVASVAASLGVPAPSVRIAPAGMMPAVIGVRHPSIVLPSDASLWSDELLQAVLLHECAHVRRRDAIMQVVSGLATAAYWWHPLAWIAARQIVRERELACDDVVIASGMAGDTYADHLLAIARSLKSSRQPALAALAMARPSQLEGRLIALLEDRPRGARPSRALISGLALGLAGLFVIAPLKLVARTAATTEDADNPPAAQAAAPQAQNVTPQPPARVDAAPRVQADSALYEVLVKALKDVDEDVRAMAVAAVAANTADYERLLALLRPLLTDTSADVRAAVVGALAKTESPQAGDVLIKALQDPDPDVRQMALTGLVRLGRKEVIPHLAAALKDHSEDVRAMAVLGIDSLNHPQKEALLLQAAADMSEDVRTLVAFALADENEPEALAALAKLAQDVSADVRQAAVMAIASKARRVDVEPLLASLHDRDAGVRAAAAIGLGSIADKAATAALTQALKDADADVRSAAAIALGSIGDAMSLQALSAAVSDVDGDVRKSAITAAAAIGGDWQAQVTVTSTIAGTVAGTIAGTLSGSLWGGQYAGNWRRAAEAQRETRRSSPEAIAATKSPAPNTVYIFGAVKRPGPYPWRAGMTARELLDAAGGTLSGRQPENGAMTVGRKTDRGFGFSFAGPATVLASGFVIEVWER